MKKVLLLILVSVIIIPAFPQGGHRKVVRQSLKDVAFKKPYPSVTKEPASFLFKDVNATVSPKLSIAETEIGTTIYDLQTNQSVQNRIYLFHDGTIGGVWTRGMNPSAYSDRGTGYNYYDGTAWGAAPTARIENIRTGWPSYVPLGTSGELSVTHTDYDGLAITKRVTKGTGAWNNGILAGPTGAVDISWPRAVTSGPDHENIHIICTTYVPYLGQDQAMLYYRSQDEGATWDQQHVIIPGLGASDYTTIGGDSYAFANPKGDTLAFVVGDNWMDLALFKSTDGGDNWSKTVIFQHPYPHFDETHTLVLDTITATDGSLSVALDQEGAAHVVFGIMRVMNDDTTDAQTSFFPYTDGIGYWKEGMPTMTDITYETLEANNQLVGYTQDVNGNDTVFEFVDDDTNPPLYYLAVTSMPSMTIDEQGHIFLLMSSMVEGLDNGVQNYRHLYGRMSEDDGATWTDFIEITGGLIHNFHECVFPSISPTTNNNIHLVYQLDEEPGMAVRGDEDPPGNNSIVYVSLGKTDFNMGLTENQKATVELSCYPNPSHGDAVLTLTLSQASQVSYCISDITGKMLINQAQRLCQAGTHYFPVNGTKLPGGVYFFTFRVNGLLKTGKLVID